MQQHRQTLRPEPFAFTTLAGLLDHELFERRPKAVTAGFPISPLDVAEDSLPLGLELASSPPAVGLELDLARSAMEQRLPGRRAVLAPGSCQIELEGFGQRRQHDLSQVAARLAPGEDDAFQDRDARIAQHQLGIHLAPGAHAVAIGAGAERRVERELPRLQLRERQAADRTGKALRKDDGFGGWPVRWTGGRRSAISDDLYHAIGCLQRGLDRIVEPGAVAGPNHELIYHHSDVVILPPVQGWNRSQIVDLTIDPDPHEATLSHVLQHVAELALAAAH